MAASVACNANNNGNANNNSVVNTNRAAGIIGLVTLTITVAPDTRL